MSFSGQQAQSFISPLMGRTTTFLLGGRQVNLDFARALSGMVAGIKESLAILDLDAFYSSNADPIFRGLPEEFLRSTTVRVPPPGADIEAEFARIFTSGQRVVVVDSLNSLFHLIALDDGGSRSRKLTFSVSSLSYFAKTNGQAVILTMYRREGFVRSTTGRSISNLSDVTASVDTKGNELSVRCERGTAWPGGTFSTRIP